MAPTSITEKNVAVFGLATETVSLVLEYLGLVSCLLGADLLLPRSCVVTVLLEELLMRTSFCESSFMQDKDLVSMGSSTESMNNDEHCTSNQDDLQNGCSSPCCQMARGR
jgi:hypothetical protein